LPAQDFGARAVHANGCVPAGCEGDAVRDLAVAAAELYSDGFIGIFLCGNVVDGVGIVGVGREIALGIVDTDEPEAVDGDVFDDESVDLLAVIVGDVHVDILGFLIWIAFPANRGAYEIHDGIDLLFGAEGIVEVVHGGTERDESFADFVLAHFVPFWYFEGTHTLLTDLNRILGVVDFV
jgi:hypothetical protein